jgi:UDP-N-acetylglucosamine 2-epimerase (non-hydrolysing)
MKTIALLAGARPNYMKIFPVWRNLHEHHPGITPVLIHTGQHYDEAMSDIFFREFGMPAPDYFLGVGSGSHAEQTAKVMTALEQVLQNNRPDMLVVAGDVNSTVAGALVAVKMGIPVAHVEAGLRSGDRTMPEEINRLVTDAISDLLLTPSRDADANLLREGIPQKKITMAGNVMIDSLVQLLPRAAESDILSRFGLTPGNYAAVTLHRPSNVDHPARLGLIMAQLSILSRTLPVVFPIHPRTRKMLELQKADRDSPGIVFAPPLGYLDFMHIQSQAALVITDSGGIQEETTFLGIPCLTIRPNTERPITITRGTNRLLDPEKESLPDSALNAVQLRPAAPPVIEGWDGHAAPRIITALKNHLSW